MSKIRRALVCAIGVAALLTGCTGAPHATSQTAATVRVPDVSGMTVSAGATAIVSAGLDGTIVYPDTVKRDDKCYVMDHTTPKTGAAVRKSEKITVYLKNAPVTVPDEVGKDITSAVLDADSACLEASAATGAGAGVVQSQSVAAGQTVAAGSPLVVTGIPAQTVYTVTGNGSRANSITWMVPGSFSEAQATEAALPWSMTFSDGKNAILSAQDDDGTSITCTITVDGRVVDTQTATGEYAIAQCTA